MRCGGPIEAFYSSLKIWLAPFGCRRSGSIGVLINMQRSASSPRFQSLVPQGSSSVACSLVSAGAVVYAIGGHGGKPLALSVVHLLVESMLFGRLGHLAAVSFTQDGTCSRKTAPFSSVPSWLKGRPLSRVSTGLKRAALVSIGSDVYECFSEKTPTGYDFQATRLVLVGV